MQQPDRMSSAASRYESAALRELAERAYGDAWACLDCDSEFPDEEALPAWYAEIGRCPMCGSVNVRTPVGRVREAMKA